ncbi:RICIN domain-containing protein [Micromonospora sp. M12]
MLDVNAGSTTQGLQLQQWSANGGTNQMWYLRPTGDGYYTIVSQASGLAADVYAASTSDGRRSCSGPPTAEPTSSGSSCPPDQRQR